MHFHKAGGTTINNLFFNYNKHIPNGNGNPLYISGDPSKAVEIPFSNYNRDEFNQFKKYLFLKNVNFVAFEWNFFKFYNELDLTNIELITSIREPYNRYISNMGKRPYPCDTLEGFYKWTFWVHPPDISAQNFTVNYNKYNYYVKMLNGFGNEPDLKINEIHLENAKKILDKFSTIIVLENKETYKLLKKYNINQLAHCNQRTTDKPKKDINQYEEFKKNNKYDYELYNYAIKLSNIQLKKQYELENCISF